MPRLILVVLALCLAALSVSIVAAPAPQADPLTRDMMSQATPRLGHEKPRANLREGHFPEEPDVEPLLRAVRLHLVVIDRSGRVRQQQTARIDALQSLPRTSTGK
jgi:hypothetical protein